MRITNAVLTLLALTTSFKYPDVPITEDALKQLTAAEHAHIAAAVGRNIPEYAFMMFHEGWRSSDAVAFTFTKPVRHLIAVDPAKLKRPKGLPYLMAHELGHVLAHERGDYTEETADQVVVCFGTKEAVRYAKESMGIKSIDCAALRAKLQ